MNNQERINETKKEDLIFIIYYIIITLSIYANYIERIYLKYQDEIARKNYRTILYIIFITATLIYIYYAYSNYKTLQKEQDNETRRLNNLSLIASILTIITGLIYLYIIYQDKDVNVELAFN